MNKSVLVSGLILALILLNQIKLGGVGLNDAVNVMDIAIATDESDFGNIRGAIIPADMKAYKPIHDFLLKLGEEKKINTIVLIGRNSSFSDKYKVAVANPGYGSGFEYPKLDENLIESLLKIDPLLIGRSSSAFKVEPSILIPAFIIKKSLPNIKIVPITVKDTAKPEDLGKLAAALNESMDEATIVLGVSGLSQKMQKGVAAFHSEADINFLENFDFEALKDADVESNKVLTVLLKYLELAQASKPALAWYDSDQNGAVIMSFEDGKFAGDRNLFISAFGDMMLGRYVRSLMDANGSKDYIFENIKGFEGRFFKGVDVVFGNLEGPISGKGSKGGSSMIFKFNEDVAGYLKNTGFNLLSITNNHAIDQGWEGRDSTIKALDDVALGWCGHPSEPAPESVYYGKFGENKFAFVCFQDVSFKLDDDAALGLIKEVKKKVDKVIVSIHWGYEYKHRADFKTQVEPGRAFIDAGADFVIGHHPHVVQNFEIYKGKFIFYSLGNFVFDQYWSSDTQEQLGLGIELGEKSKVYLFPMQSEASQPRLMDAEESKIWFNEFISYGDYDDKLKDQIKSGVIEAF